MTQKNNLFKGQQKKKTVPPNRHGKITHIRKGKRYVKPSNFTKEMDADRFFLAAEFDYCGDVMDVIHYPSGLQGEIADHSTSVNSHMSLDRIRSPKSYCSMELSKFINNCNEIKAATAANKEGGQLSIVKPPPEPARAAKKET
ncbi:hypothetical protein NC651_022130 [Populus alba x Populus x berolinensis]|nr:hypothetical protein NC651_022130 [Populus alba x Populus x berolinensis]